MERADTIATIMVLFTRVSKFKSTIPNATEWRFATLPVRSLWNSVPAYSGKAGRMRQAAIRTAILLGFLQLGLDNNSQVEDIQSDYQIAEIGRKGAWRH